MPCRRGGQEIQPVVQDLSRVTGSSVEPETRAVRSPHVAQVPASLPERYRETSAEQTDSEAVRIQRFARKSNFRCESIRNTVQTFHHRCSFGKRSMCLSLCPESRRRAAANYKRNFPTNRSVPDQERC